MRLETTLPLLVLVALLQRRRIALRFLLLPVVVHVLRSSLSFSLSLSSSSLSRLPIFNEDADVPAVLAIVLGLLLGHDRAAGVILLMVTGGEALEEIAMERAGGALQGLLARAPPGVSHVLRRGVLALVNGARGAAEHKNSNVVNLFVDKRDDNSSSAADAGADVSSCAIVVNGNADLNSVEKVKSKIMENGISEKASSDVGDTASDFVAISSSKKDLAEIVPMRDGSNSDVVEEEGLVLNPNLVVHVATGDVQAGDILFVRQSEVVPVDSILLGKTSATINETLFTGEALDAVKLPGEVIIGGSVNHGKSIWMKAKATYEDSVLSLMKAQLQQALERKANVELQSKKIADGFTPFTLIVAALAFFVAIRSKKSIRTSWEVVLSVLMSATPCPAAIGVPVAMLSGMSVASRQFGATVKSGVALENLAKVSCVVLDKTGTLTLGKPSVASVTELVTPDRPKNGGLVITMDLALQFLSSVEEHSNHVLANAIREYVRKIVKQPKENHATSIEIVQGEGISGIINDQYRVKIGTFSYCFSSVATSSLREEKEEKGVLLTAYFSISLLEGGESAMNGRINFRDELRPHAAELVAYLRNQLKIRRVVILSGDRSSNLSHIANKLGISEFHLCLPHEKVQWIRKFQAEGECVLMVGDGANDTAALAAADVGMSLDASNLSAESSSIVLLNPDLMSVALLIRLGRRVVKIAKRTVSVGMTISTVQIILAATGLTPPYVSAIAQEIVDLGTIIHALQALSL